MIRRPHDAPARESSESAIKRSSDQANQRLSESANQRLADQPLRELVHLPHADDVDVGANLLAVGLGDDHRAEAESGRLAGAQVCLRHAADLAEQSYLSED